MILRRRSRDGNSHQAWQSANGARRTRTRHDPAGRHVRYPAETPITNLYLSMLDRMSVSVNSIGDSTGRLEGL